ncbi:hypothetical protein ELY39_17655 [Escherichia coli]|nr:hypothetical protein [Escherichia coli]EKK0708188.1 hypothetical protein [Escherichia coli]TFL68064.1 hypothetical protein ELY39_17655 [Escherichia coli]
MHVPPLDTDVDVVLAECSDRLSELKARCAALAAENAGLKSGILQASENMEAHHDDHGLFSYDADGEQMDALLRLCDAQDSIASLENVKTPDTDAFLAEVRAQGVDMAMEHMQSSGSLTFGDCYISLNEFAAELRKGGNQ